MTYTLGNAATSALNFAATSTGKTFTSAGKTFGNLTFNGVGGSWTLQDNLATGATATMTLTNGTLNANNKTVTTGLFSSSNSNTRTLTMGSGTWTLAGAGTIWDTSTATNLTLTRGTSTLALTSASGSAKTFAGGGKSFYNLSVTAGGAGVLTFTGSNTFNNFTINSPKTVKFTAGTTTTIEGSFIATGTVGNLITLDTDTGASTWTISKASGVVACNYLSLSRSIATGGATFYAGANSTNGGSNAGWIFASIPGDAGGTITYAGGYTIHTFTSSGTYHASSNHNVEVLDSLAEGYESEFIIDRQYLRYGLSLEEIGNRIKAFSPEAIGVSFLFSSQAHNAHAIARLTKEINKNIFLFFGCFLQKFRHFH